MDFVGNGEQRQKRKDEAMEHIRTSNGVNLTAFRFTFRPPGRASFCCAHETGGSSPSFLLPHSSTGW